MEFVATSALVRFALRRDRVRILVWVLSIVSLVGLTAASVKGLYPTQHDLDVAKAASQDNAAAIAFNGPPQGLDTVGGEVAFQSGAFGLAVVALMSLLMLGRLTRGEEEAGRLEMVRSLPVGARAPSAAALAVVAGMDVAVGLLVAALCMAIGLPFAGSVNFGAGFMLVGLCFAGVAMVAAQITENTRVVYGIAGAVVGAAYLVRAVGDIGNGALSWVSPIGWAQKARPFAGEAWWPFLLLLLATAAFAVVAVALSARRDLGGGLVPPRPGRARAAASLGLPVGLAVRLQRGVVIGWAIGVLVTGFAYGSITSSVPDFVKDNQALEDLVAQIGGKAGLIDSYLATSFRIIALLAAGSAIQSILRLRTEESALRAEPLLATPVSRWRWAASHASVAFGGGVIVLAVAGLSIGLSYGFIGGGISVVPRLFGSALVYLPALWLLGALGLALVGVAPRAVGVTWGVLAACFVIAFFGDTLNLPSLVKDLSPFQHVPQMPARGFSLLPVALLTLVAAGLSGVGLAGLRHRDIG